MRRIRLTHARRAVTQRARVSGCVLVGLTFVAAACGVPTDPSVRGIDPDEVPSELAIPTSTSTTTTTVPVPVSTTTTVPVQTERVRLYFVVDDRIVEVSRFVPDLPVTPTEVMTLLAGGSIAEDGLVEVRSFVRPADLAGVAVAGGTATVDLVTTFTEFTGPDQILGVGQMVLTLTARPGIGRVAFRLDGVPIDVPRGDGSLGPSMAREDYDSVRA